MMKGMTASVLVAGAIALCRLPATFGQWVIPPDVYKEGCIVDGCCEDDCCGFGTSWNSQAGRCAVDPNSTGFNGTHVEEWISGCIARACCGDDCCLDGSYYDPDDAFCVAFNCFGPVRDEGPGDPVQEPTSSPTILPPSTLSPTAIQTSGLVTKVTVGMYARGGGTEGAMEGWADKVAGAGKGVGFSTGTDIINNLKAASGANKQIAKLVIFSHGWDPRFNDDGTLGNNRGGVWSDANPNRAGFYSEKKVGDNAAAKYLKDLANEIAAGNIKFSADCTIVLTGCRVAMSDFPTRLAKITGCKVTVAKGASSPVVKDGRENGQFSSAAGTLKERKAAGGNKKLGWVEVSKDGSMKDKGRFLQVIN